jgi:hypothetical protein
LQAKEVLRAPFAVTFPDLLNFGLLLKKMTAVFFFGFPASAAALNVPTASAAIANITRTFAPLIGSLLLDLAVRRA